jgi:hypothetical protein
MAFSGASDPPSLTVKERSCLLRAARQRLAQLHEEYDGVIGRPDVGHKQDTLFSEIACITAGIQWLWHQKAIDE